MRGERPFQGRERERERRERESNVMGVINLRQVGRVSQ